jgi:hypothetical protein
MHLSGGAGETWTLLVSPEGRRPWQTWTDAWVGREASAHTSAGVAPAFRLEAGERVSGMRRAERAR